MDRAVAPGLVTDISYCTGSPTTAMPSAGAIRVLLSINDGTVPFVTSAMSAEISVLSVGSVYAAPNITIYKWTATARAAETTLKYSATGWGLSQIQ